MKQNKTNQTIRAKLNSMWNIKFHGHHTRWRNNHTAGQTPLAVWQASELDRQQNLCAVSWVLTILLIQRETAAQAQAHRGHVFGSAWQTSGWLAAAVHLICPEVPVQQQRQRHWQLVKPARARRTSAA